MPRFCRIAFCWAILLGGLCSSNAWGQYSALATPFNTAGGSFYENIGITWGFSGRNIFFNGIGAAPPPFGGHDPGADGSFGFRSGGFSFRLNAGQGSSTTLGSQTPMIVVPDGVPGALFDGRQQPFVTGVVPVVGAAPAMVGSPPVYVVSPLAERLSRLQAEQTLREAAARPRQAPDRVEPAAAAPSPKDDPPLILGVP
jgi:hypothetical protein